jgi:hypothetical protein
MWSAGGFSSGEDATGEETAKDDGAMMDFLREWVSTIGFVAALFALQWMTRKWRMCQYDADRERALRKRESDRADRMGERFGEHV